MERLSDATELVERLSRIYHDLNSVIDRRQKVLGDNPQSFPGMSTPGIGYFVTNGDVSLLQKISIDLAAEIHKIKRTHDV